MGTSLKRLGKEAQNSALAWLLAGEGSIGLSKSGGDGRYCVVVKVGSTDYELLKPVSGLLGGKIHISRILPSGKTFYDWRLTGRRAVALLKILLPYLPIKQRQAELAIEFWTLRNRQVQQWFKRGREPNSGHRGWKRGKLGYTDKLLNIAETIHRLNGG